MTRRKRHLDVRRRVRHAVGIAYMLARALPDAPDFASTYFTDFGAEHVRRRHQPGDRRLGQSVAAAARYEATL